MSNCLTEMLDFIARELKASSVESQTAEEISEHLIITFRQNYGGVRIYIHKKSNDYAERNAEI